MARRSRSTARGWSRMSSSATQVLPHEHLHVRGHVVRLARGVHQANPLGIGALDLEIAAAHLAMKGQRLPLEVIQPPPPDAIEADLRIEVEEQREVGQYAAGGDEVQLADHRGIETAPVALVRHG